MQPASKNAIPYTAPMECLPVSRIPEGNEWIYELKLVGYRANAIRDRDGIRLLSRRGKDLTKSYPRVSQELPDVLQLNTALDGELVAFDDEGRLSFNALQNAASGTNVIFFAFDVLASQGEGVKHLPMRDRKELLKSALNGTGRVQLSEHLGGPLAKFLEGVKQIGGEGVVAKRLDKPYEPRRRSGSWSKMRINIGQEFVIGGFRQAATGLTRSLWAIMRAANSSTLLGSEPALCRHPVESSTNERRLRGRARRFFICAFRQFALVARRLAVRSSQK
jgi:bifunctional non-homologous end joining protein LigD